MKSLAEFIQTTREKAGYSVYGLAQKAQQEKKQGIQYMGWRKKQA